MVDIKSTAALLTSVGALIGCYISWSKIGQELKRLELEHKKIEAQFGQELSAERAARNLLECTTSKRSTIAFIFYL